MEVTEQGPKLVERNMENILDLRKIWRKKAFPEKKQENHCIQESDYPIYTKNTMKIIHQDKIWYNANFGEWYLNISLGTIETHSKAVSREKLWFVCSHVGFTFRTTAVGMAKGKKSYRFL